MRLLEGEEAEAPTEAEAALAGPLTVERVRTGGGPPAWAVVQAAEPVARGGRAAALFPSRGEALRLAAVLPAVPAPNPYNLSDRPKRLGWPLHLNRSHVGHVSRLARESAGPEALAALGRALARRVEALLDRRAA